jgi:hypothetical protein
MTTKISADNLKADIAITTTGDIDVSSGTLTLANDQISGDKISGGTISTFTSTGIDDNATSTAITIQSDGDIGIGTTNPAFSFGKGLRIQNSGTSTLRLQDDGVHGFEIRASSTAAEFASANGKPFTFYTNASERMRIDSSGNVGIGTSSPVTLKSATTLQVNGNAKLGDNNARGLLSLGDITASDANVGIWRGSAGAYAGTGNYLNLGGYDGIAFTTGNALIASQTERMRIDSSGNVGIGTSGPSEKLDVFGNVRIGGAGNLETDTKLYVADTGGDAYLQIKGADSTGTVGIKLGRNSNAVQSGMDWSASDNALKFYTNNFTERMRIDLSGNLLVGKTALEYESTAGIILRNDGLISCIRSGGNVTDFNRLSSDGEIFRISKDGTTVGDISSNNGSIELNSQGSSLKFSHLGTNVGFITNYAFGVYADNTVDLGSSSGSFKDLYLGGGLYVGGTGTANYLDDYEEGTWNPQENNGVILTDNETPRYTKIGDIVHLWFDVTVASNTNGNAFDISGVPFSARDIGCAGGVVYFCDMNNSISDAGLSFTYHDTALRVQLRSGYDATVSLTNMSGHRISGCIIYKTT